MNSRQLLIALVLECKGNWKKVFDKINGRKYPSEKFLEKAVKYLDREDIVTIVEERYPEEYKRMIAPEFVLQEIEEGVFVPFVG